ncbi:hypothetical protein F4823DRAFT_567726 [Ustulina deusta]|nr:hypothetical protein F4823DRAFT_567726 [Ustulina deusta]
MDAGRKRRQFLQGVAVHVKTTAAIREQMRNADENKSRIFGTIRPYPSTENTSSAKPGNIREQNVTSKVRQRPQMMGPVVALFPTLSSGVAMHMIIAITTRFHLSIKILQTMWKGTISQQLIAVDIMLATALHSLGD